MMVNLFLPLQSDFDTFGAHAAHRLHRAATETTGPSQGSLPFVPTELLTPVASSVGIQLLTCMGWRQGKGIGFLDLATEGGLCIPNVLVPSEKPKLDRFGLGYDPFRGMESFREAKVGGVSYHK